VPIRWLEISLFEGPINENNVWHEGSGMQTAIDKSFIWKLPLLRGKTQAIKDVFFAAIVQRSFNDPR